MSLNLVIDGSISDIPQQVEAQNGGKTCLRLAAKETRITGKNVAGVSIPLNIKASTSPAEFDSGTTGGAMIRLHDDGTSNVFYDVGIDKSGNLFIRQGGTLVLTIAQDGKVTILGDLVVTGTINGQ